MGRRNRWNFGVVAVALLSGAAAAETITVGGVARTYSVIVPAAKPAALVIVLHGNLQQGADVARGTSWPAVARREGFAVAFPDGLNRAWADLRAEAERLGRKPPAGTNDLAFIAALVGKLVAAGTADAGRIYVTGVSNGGAMTLSLACTHGETFAAAAAVIINMTAGLGAACKPGPLLPMLVMNGTEDPLIPYGGGKGTSRFSADGFWSTAKTVQFWRDRNGCGAGDGKLERLPDRDPADGSTVTRVDYDCPARLDVVLYRVDGGGHRMPGANPDARWVPFVDRLLGRQNHDIDGAEAIWAFFKRFERRP